MTDGTQEPVLPGLREQEHVLHEAAHALDLQRHELLDAPHLGRVGLVGEGEHLELAADDRQRGAQLVRGVGDERRLAVERVLEAVEHVVEGLGQHAHLVVAGGDLHPRAEVAGVDARRHARHAPQRGRHARGDREAARERGQDRERAREQELVAHRALGAVGGRGRLAHAEARDRAPVSARDPRPAAGCDRRREAGGS